MLALAGCAARLPPPPPQDTVRDLALLSVLGEQSGVRVIAVNGRSLASGLPVGRKPLDEPVGIDPGAALWLAPGFHRIELQFVRDIDGGISFTKVEVPATLAAGRIYIARPLDAAQRGAVAFSLVDYGGSYPLECLPWSVHASRARDSQGRRQPFTRADLLDCQAQSPR